MEHLPKLITLLFFLRVAYLVSRRVWLSYKWTTARYKVESRQALKQLVPLGSIRLMMRFRGAHGNMGFTYGKVYPLELTIRGTLLVAKFGSVWVPYESYRAFNRNWELASSDYGRIYVEADRINLV